MHFSLTLATSHPNYVNVILKNPLEEDVAINELSKL